MSDLTPGLQARLDQGRAAHGAITDMVASHYRGLIEAGMSTKNAETQANMVLDRVWAILAADAEWKRTLEIRSQMASALMPRVKGDSVSGQP